MLCEISIKNVAVIERLHMEMRGGMTVLTGETGAGKSIIIDSINMLLGDRTNKTLVRYGQKKAVVQGVFRVDPNPETEEFLEDEDQLIITREVTAEGKSTVRINGLMVPLARLRSMAPYLIDIHGQHDNQALLTPSKHVGFLDSFAGNSREREEYRELYQRYRQLQRQLDELQTDENEKARRIDLLEYQHSEITRAGLRKGEEEELKAQRDQVANAEKIASAAAQAYDNLYGGEEIQSAYDALSSAINSLEEIREFAPEIQQVWESVSDLVYTIEDAAHELKEYADRVEYDPQLLDELEERLDLISRLKRKYGNSVEEILAFGKKIEEELSEIQSADEKKAELEQAVQDAEKALAAAANVLTETRRKAGMRLQTEIEQSLQELDMDKSVFRVEVGAAGDYTPGGADHVEFMISTNPGEPLKPLAQIASGGELSRVMLAIKSILADSDHVDTLIFDEIDTGVSGRAAQKIALKLGKIGRSKQVICITHLPQLAAMADNHFLIEKEVTDTAASTAVRLLERDERRTELARITDGDITKTSLEHAEEMLKRAEEYKCGK